MTRFRGFQAACGLVVAMAVTARAQTVILVRHGESPKHEKNEDVPLTDAGKARAVQLGQTLKDLRINSIFVDTSKRCLETAEPVERTTGIAHKLLPELEDDVKEAAGLANVLNRDLKPDDVAVVVMHHHLMPLALCLLVHPASKSVEWELDPPCGDGQIPTKAALKKLNDDLFVLKKIGDKQWTLVRLKYGPLTAEKAK